MSLLQTVKLQFLRLNDKAFRRWLDQQFDGQNHLINLALFIAAIGLFDSASNGHMEAGEAWSAFIATAALGTTAHWFRLNRAYAIYSHELELKERERELADLQSDAKVIVDHLPNGVYLFKASGSDDQIDVESMHSPLFQDDLKSGEGKDSLEAIWKASGHSLETIHEWNSLLYQSIGDTILQWDFNAKKLPKELRVNLERGTRIVNANWEAIRSESGIVQKIILLLDDVTELRLMYEDSRSRSDDAKRLMELISNSPRKMGEFFALAESVLSEGKAAMIEGSETATLNFRNIHTLKGMARGYQLTELSACFHSLEDSLQSQALSSSLSLQHLPSFQACEISLRNYKSLFLKAYTRQISGNQVTVDPKVVLDLTHQIETAYVRSDIETAFNSLNEIRAIFATTLDKIVIDEISMLRKLADELDKPHPNLYINELDVQLTETGKITLRKVFVHLFRNSIDHGIESEKEREAKGKANRGQISIHTARSQNFYRITYKDDGQGLSLQKILKKAIDLGMADADRNYSPKETAELIFQSGLSTAALSNPISGRGVGMDAIRSFLRQEGGNISIELDPVSEGAFHMFSFVIDIPMKKEIQEPMPLKKVV